MRFTHYIDMAYPDALQEVMINEGFVAAAALFQRFHLAYCVGEEAKIKIRKGSQLAQGHTANQWMN